jgi:hypothetical protein
MLASVLSSPAAIQASVYVVRAFVRMRSIIADYSSLLARVDELEEKYDSSFTDVFAAIRHLMAPKNHQRAIGFVAPTTNNRSRASKK